MTSGNLSGRPPTLSNAQALNELADIADGFLLHNRDIVQRMDDSLVRSSGEMLRRARGYVPDALPLPPGARRHPAAAGSRRGYEKYLLPRRAAAKRC